jgi:hypothetical protein
MNVSVIVVGVIIASIGEIRFVLTGVICALLGVTFEATRLAMVEKLLNSSEFKMEPMVSLYYFAPVCALMNGSVALFLEFPNLTMESIMDLGLFTLLANAGVAFMLNLAVVFLVRCFACSVQSNMISDWQDFRFSPYPLRSSQGHSPRYCLDGHFPRSSLWPPSLWLLHRSRRSHLLQAGW